MVGAGAFENVKEATDKFFALKEAIIPDKELTNLYKDRYEKYRKIYPAVKEYTKKSFNKWKLTITGGLYEKINLKTMILIIAALAIIMSCFIISALANENDANDATIEINANKKLNASLIKKWDLRTTDKWRRIRQLSHQLLLYVRNYWCCIQR